MAPAVRRNLASQRTASKEERQTQLIKATIRSIARRGLSETTIATVAKEAGLSQGIINLHFQSKDRLLVETLRYVADEYTMPALSFVSTDSSAMIRSRFFSTYRW